MILKKGPMAVKGISFSKSRTIGPIIPLIKVFQTRDIDELAIIDVTNISIYEDENLKRFDWVKQISSFSTMPLSIGGGVRNLNQASHLIKLGADKVILNTSIWKKQSLIKEIIDKHGAQSVLASIDVKKTEKGYFIYNHHKNDLTDIPLHETLLFAESIGVGEVILTSVNNEGKRNGYDIELYKYARKFITMPLIANGGAGHQKDFLELAKENIVEAFAAGACYHFSSLTPREVAEFLRQEKFNMRRYKYK
tara:strand:+ start:915 stop:1667 length:753 start_codon:yes stop_codon:yes gene_type:complete